MDANVIRLAGVTAHFRDPRINTAKIGLPSRTLHCPPPCTIHGLLCAAKGQWIDPMTLCLGWRMDYEGTNSDFQTSHLPQRNQYSVALGKQAVKISPVEREILTFPVLSILVLAGVENVWFEKPANPLSLGRSEDLIVEKLFQSSSVKNIPNGDIARQCLPIGTGSGTIYTAPLYFEELRRPVLMSPKVDATETQNILSMNMVQVEKTGENFYVWNFGSLIS